MQGFPSQPQNRFPSIAATIDSQKHNPDFSLNEVELLDQNIINLLADFFTKYSHFTNVDLNKTNITQKGLETLCRPFQGFGNIRSLSLKGNKFSGGLNALAPFLNTTKTLRNLELNNNKLGPNDAYVIANAIKVNPKIISFDLSWNEIDDNGAKAILNSVYENKYIQNVQLKGNPINQNLLANLEAALSSNKEKNKDLAEEARNYRGNFNQQPSHQIDNKAYYRDPYAYDNMLNELQALRSQEAVEQRRLVDLERKLNSSIHENRTLRVELERYKQELKVEIERKDDLQRGDDERLKEKEEEIHNLQENHRINMDKAIDESNRRIKDVTKEWENRCGSLEDRIKSLQRTNDELSSELHKLTDKAAAMVLRHEDELRDSTERIHEEEYSKYQAAIRGLEARLVAIEQSRHDMRKANEEYLQESEKSEKKTLAELSELKHEAELLRAEKEQFDIRIREFEDQEERLKADLISKNSAIDKLQTEVNHMGQALETMRHQNHNDMEKMIQEQQEEKREWETEREGQMRRISELEKAKRHSQMEISRIRQDYQRLAELLQNAVNKSIIHTFSENKYI